MTDVNQDVAPADDEPAWTLHQGTLRVVADPDREDAFFFRLDTEAGTWDMNLDDGAFVPEVFDWDGRRVKVLSGAMAIAMEADAENPTPTGEKMMQALRIELDEDAA